MHFCLIFFQNFGKHWFLKFVEIYVTLGFENFTRIIPLPLFGNIGKFIENNRKKFTKFWEPLNISDFNIFVKRNYFECIWKKKKYKNVNLIKKMLKFWGSLTSQFENFHAQFFGTTGFRNVGKFIEMFKIWFFFQNPYFHKNCIFLQILGSTNLV